MSRITTTILVFMLLMNGTVTIMETSGLNDDLGVSLAPGVEDTMDDIVENARTGFTAGEGSTQTLFSLIVAGLNIFKLMVESVYAMPQMMINLGFPGYIVIAFFAPMYVLSTLEMVFIATGRDAI